MADINSGIYSLPPAILSQDLSQSYWYWSGQLPQSTTNAPPTSPGDVSSHDTPIFASGTNELDKYRALFLIIGIVIGAFVLGKR